MIALCFSAERGAWGNNGESRGVACKIRIFGALRLRRERGAIVFGDGGKKEDEDAEARTGT